MPTCPNCESHVTDRFTRVFGNEDNEIDGCPHCLGYREMKTGAFTTEESS